MPKITLAVGEEGLEFKNPSQARKELKSLLEKHMKSTSKITANNGRIIYRCNEANQVVTELEF